MPVRDPLFAQLPAQQYGAAFHLAGEVEQSDIEVLHLYSGGVNLGQRVFYALDGLFALRLAPRHLNDVHQQSSAEEDAVGEVLELGIDGFNQLLAVNGGAQERLQNRQKALGFFEGETTIGHTGI